MLHFRHQPENLEKCELVVTLLLDDLLIPILCCAGQLLQISNECITLVLMEGACAVVSGLPACNGYMGAVSVI